MIGEFSNSILRMEVKVKSLGRVRLFATAWTVAHQAPPSTGFSRQEYWNGVPCLPSGIFLTQESNPCLPVSPALQVDSIPTEPPGKAVDRHIDF